MPAFAAIAAFFLVTEHGAHAFGGLHYLLLTACLLLLRPAHTPRRKTARAHQYHARTAHRIADVLLGHGQLCRRGFLLGGTFTLRWARTLRERPFAAIPLLFAIQQIVEGVIWLTFSRDAPLLNTRP